MAVLKADRLLSSLQKAKTAGIIERRIDLAGVEVVLSNLSPGAFEEAVSETKDLEDVEYMHAMQAGQVSRSIVELDGVDLRDCEFVEVVVPEQYEGGVRDKTVNMMRHEWLASNVLATWSREALGVAWRVLMELMAQAEKKSAENIVFDTSLESSEDRFRRLLGESLDVAKELPNSLVEAILDENGLLTKTSEEELEAVHRRAKEFAEEMSREREATPEPEPEEPQPEPEPPPRAPEPMTPEGWACPSCGVTNIPDSVFCGSCGARRGGPPVIDPQLLMANRERLNETAAVAVQQSSAKPLSPQRRAQIAAEQEMLGDVSMPQKPVLPNGQPPSTEVAEVRGPGPRAQAPLVIDQAPTGGINPRFNPGGRRR